MMDAKIRAEYKRRRTVAIKKLREAGLSETEIQDELAKIREALGIASVESDGHGSVENLPARIESSDSHERARAKKPTFKPKPGYDEHGNSLNAENVARYDAILEQNSERRCTATNTKGERCRSYAIPGGQVCRNHGGATRHVKEAARIRLEMASNRLMGRLIEFAFDDTRPASVQLDAIKDSLNRAGFNKPAQVEVGPIKAYEIVFDSIQHTPSDYREAMNPVGSEPDSLGLTDAGQNEGFEPTAYYEPNYAGGQSDSQSKPTPPAPAGERQSPRDDGRRYGDSNRLSADERRVQRDRDRYHSSAAMTGEDALQAANEANAALGSLRALPRGRG